jgi:hypothetical protein
LMPLRRQGQEAEMQHGRRESIERLGELEERLRILEGPGSSSNIEERLQGLTENVHKLAQNSGGFLESLSKSFDLLHSTVAGLLDRLGKVEGSLRSGRGLLGRIGTEDDPASRFDDLESDIKSMLESINALKEREAANYNQVTFQIQMLVGALRARDAWAKFDKYDAVVTSLGKKLLDGFYEDGKSWAHDQNEWGHNLSEIDMLLAQWSKHHQSFLRLTHHELEGTPQPPSHIVKDTHENIVRFKTVWLAQQRYANQRDGIINFFATKAIEFPG